MAPWTVAHQALLSIGLSRREYWSGLPFPSPGDLPDPGIKPRSPALQAGSLPAELPGKPLFIVYFWDFPLIFWTQLTGAKLQPCEWANAIANSNDLGTSVRLSFLGSFTYIHCLLKESQVTRINFSVVYHDNAMPK